MKNFDHGFTRMNTGGEQLLLSVFICVYPWFE